MRRVEKDLRKIENDLDGTQQYFAPAQNDLRRNENGFICGRKGVRGIGEESRAVEKRLRGREIEVRGIENDLIGGQNGRFWVFNGVIFK